MNAKGWTRAPLNLVADLYQGLGFPKHLQGRDTGDLGFYKVSDISRAVAAGSEALGPAAHCITRGEAAGLRATVLPRNSVVFARIGEAIKLNRRALLPTEALVDNNVMGAKAKAGIDDRYLFYFFKSLKLGELAQATTVPAVRSSDIAAIDVPIAPTREQSRIVSKLDELFSRIDEGERALERVSMLVERYRQSVLKAAVTGELTRAWREELKDKLESGEALLARILKARRDAWEKAELEKMKAKGITPANNKWKQKLEEPVPPDTTGLPQLPAGWTYSRLESLVAPGGFMSDGDWVESKDQDPNGDVRLIQLADVGDGVFRNKSSRFLTSAKASELGCTYLLPGDVLIARLGHPLGKSCLFPGVKKPCVTVVDVHIIRCLNDSLSHEWLVQLINSPQVRSRISADISGTTRPRITGAKLKELVIPVPGVDEQRQIAERIAEVMCHVERVGESALHQARVSQALRQSILKAAFCGGLVAQDPVDEPASTLLERIAAERGADTAKPKRGRKKKTIA